MLKRNGQNSILDLSLACLGFEVFLLPFNPIFPGKGLVALMLNKKILSFDCGESAPNSSGLLVSTNLKSSKLVYRVIFMVPRGA